MKSALILPFVFAALMSAAQVPEKVIKEFKRIHPGARFIEWKTDWGLLEDLYRVTYTNWYRQTLVFNRNADILISESELPPDYIPNEIHRFMKQYYPHTKYVVWDSFDEENNRSYFVICNESKKLLFTNECKFRDEEEMGKQKKQNLLSIFTSGN